MYWEMLINILDLVGWIAITATLICFYKGIKFHQQDMIHIRQSLFGIREEFLSKYSNTQKLITLSTPEMDKKFDDIMLALREINSQLKIIDSKVGDLNMRVSIAEVRLEERKPQLLLPARQIKMRKKPGPKPK
jgi:hypothetical protein